MLFRIARTLNRALQGGRVERFDSVYPALNRVHHDRPVTGRTIEGVEAAGKHVLIRFSGGLVLRTHLRMNGNWHIYRRGERWRRSRADMRVLVATDAWEAVAFTVPVAEFLEGEAAIDEQRDLAAMGPDLLGETFDTAEAMRRVRERGEEEIEVVLLRQQVVAGIGNIFKSETLFLTGIHPFTPASALSDADLERVLAKARRLLQANVHRDSPPAIVTYKGLGPNHRHEDGVWVYGRSGKPCRRCGTPIAWQRSGPHSRSTYWCPTCQPER
jgi:endonuclease-8